MKIEFDEFEVTLHLDCSGQVIGVGTVKEYFEDGGHRFLLESELPMFYEDHAGMIEIMASKEMERRNNEEWDQCRSLAPIVNYDDNGPRNYVPLGEIE